MAWGQGKRSGSLAPRPQGDVAWRRGQRSGHEGHGRNNILEVSYVISSVHTTEWIGNFSVVYRVVTLLLIGEPDELYTCELSLGLTSPAIVLHVLETAVFTLKYTSGS